MALSIHAFELGVLAQLPDGCFRPLVPDSLHSAKRKFACVDNVITVNLSTLSPKTGA